MHAARDSRKGKHDNPRSQGEGVGALAAIEGLRLFRKGKTDSYEKKIIKKSRIDILNNIMRKNNKKLLKKNS